MPAIHGADLSHWQSGTLNFAAAKKAGLRFLYHKATEGTGYTDPNYARRRTQARGAGVPFGAYHFAKTSGSPETQASHFLKVAAPRKGDMRPMLDFEDPALGRWSVARKSDFVRRFVAVIERETGVKPFIYIPGTWALNSTFDCPLWVPRYSNSNAAPRIPRPWKTYTVWQFSNGVYGNPKSIAGLGHVDLNTVNMNPAEFVATFTIGGTAPKPTAPKEKPVPEQTPDHPWKGDPNYGLTHGPDVEALKDQMQDIIALAGEIGDNAKDKDKADFFHKEVDRLTDELNHIRSAINAWEWPDPKAKGR